MLMPLTLNKPPTGAFSGIAGCTPSIASQWQAMPVSSGAFGKGASITYMLDKNMGTSASTQTILAHSTTNVASDFLHLSNPHPYHQCKTNPYAQQPFWTAKDLQM